jgi:hypothetical protein
MKLSRAIISAAILGGIASAGALIYALAPAFGLLIVALVMAGSLWIMTNLNANMMPSPDPTNLHALTTNHY